MLKYDKQFKLAIVKQYIARQCGVKPLRGQTASRPQWLADGLIPISVWPTCCNETSERSYHVRNG